MSALARVLRRRPGRRFVAAALSLALLGLDRAPAPARPPSELFGRLYARVELARLYPDSKTFADATPRRPPAAIMARYRAATPKGRAELQAFVDADFILPRPAGVDGAPVGGDLKAHIKANWPRLIRGPDRPAPWSSAVALARPYVVPGGRFREAYYWDSYFTMLGLVRDGQDQVAASMVADFEDVLGRYGHVPNGMRTYYLSRSQPPVLYLMVALTGPEPDRAWARDLGALKTEYRFWMQGERALRPGRAHRRVVAMPDGAVLNRYWDDRAAPRDESYREDVELAERSGRPRAQLYRDLRAAAESGWDFSSRWLADGRSLSTIRTTAIVPVDLNSLLYGLEQAIATGCRQLRDAGCDADFTARARRRRAAMDRYLWDAASGRYLDYDWRLGRPTDRPSAAMLYPLFVRAASPRQAHAVAAAVRRDLLAPGGLATTTVRTGQQWDAPNGWAPLQWIAVSGLRAYGEGDLARQIGERWVANVARSYRASGKLVEKYDVSDPGAPGGGGEYPLQDGFGWTNGVTRALLDLYPQAAAPDPAQR